MHHIYTTRAFVVGSTPHGEAGKFLYLFTKDFGMIGATAQGIRLSKSKLRYHLQDFSYSDVSIVRGKDVWRVTGAHGILVKKSHVMFLRILKLLKRLLPGEEKNEELFKIVDELYKIEISDMLVEDIERLTVLRILNMLGYIKSDENIRILLDSHEINNELLSTVSINKSQIVKMINHALKESQL